MAVRYCLFALDNASAEDVALLDGRESAQALRFRFERDRRRFVARRAGLRRLLGRHVDQDPAKLLFKTNGHGKPTIAGGPSFSLSHSRDHAMVAIAGDGEIGCDIEWRDPDLGTPEIAARFFASAEIAALNGLPQDQRLDGFFACWSRKEAYVKALGLGLSYPLDRFIVETDPRRPARLIDALPGWHIHAFQPLPGLHAAIVTNEASLPQPLELTAAPAIAA